MVGDIIKGERSWGEAGEGSESDEEEDDDDDGDGNGEEWFILLFTIFEVEVSFTEGWEWWWSIIVDCLCNPYFSITSWDSIWILASKSE